MVLDAFATRPSRNGVRDEVHRAALRRLGEPGGDVPRQQAGRDRRAAGDARRVGVT